MMLSEANWNEEQIAQWLVKMKIQNFSINSDMTVNVDGDVNLFDKKLEAFPFKFKKVTGDFLVRHNNFISLANFPEFIGGDLSISHNPRFKGFDKATTSEIGGKFLFSKCNITSLEGISTAITKFTKPNPSESNFDLEGIDYNIKSGGIGLILIENLKLDKRYANPYTTMDFAKAMKIIEKYFGRPNDIFDCQDELLHANLEEFAKI